MREGTGEEREKGLERSERRDWGGVREGAGESERRDWGGM